MNCSSCLCSKLIAKQLYLYGGGARWEQSVRRCTRRCTRQQRAKELPGWMTTWKYIDYFYDTKCWKMISNVSKYCFISPSKQLLPPFHFLYMIFISHTNHQHTHTVVWDIQINVFFFYVKFWSALESLTALYQHIPIKAKKRILYLTKTGSCFYCSFEVTRL